MLAAVLAVFGLGLLSGCNTGEIQAVAAGVQTVADALVQLDNGNNSSNQNFSLSDLINQFTN